MGQCFWTDMVGCAEDCTPPVIVPGTTNMLPMLYASNDLIIQALDPAFVFTAPVVIEDVKVYVADDYSGCGWTSRRLALNGEAPGSTANDYPDANYSFMGNTFEPLEFFMPSVITPPVEVGGIPMALGDPGNYDNPGDPHVVSVLAGTVFTALNVGAGGGVAGVYVFRVRDGAGNTIVAGEAMSTCF